MVPVLLPKTGHVLLQELEAAHPLGALPEVEVRHEQARGQPCSGVSHSPSCFRAIRLSGRSRSVSGRFVVNPCSARTRQYCASARTPARSSSSCTATPSNVLSRRLQRVTPCMSHRTLFRGSASNASVLRG